MPKLLKWLIVLFLFTGIALAAYFWFEGNSRVKDIQTLDIGNIVSEVQKQVLTASPLNVGGQSNDVVLLKSKIIEETNKQRIENGLSALAENAQLSNAAAAKANDMFDKQYFEHISPTGTGPGELVSNYGYEYLVTGENLILGNFKDEAEMLDNWMKSPGHRANILNGSYSEIGVSVIKGVYKGEPVWIAVQEFGLPLSACPAPDGLLKARIENSKVQLEAMVSGLDRKKSDIDKAANQGSAYYNQLVDEYNQMVRDYNLLANELKDFVADYNRQVNSFNNCVVKSQK